MSQAFLVLSCFFLAGIIFSWFVLWGVTRRLSDLEDQFLGLAIMVMKEGLVRDIDVLNEMTKERNDDGSK